MRAGLFYIFFVAFALLVVASKQTNNEPLRFDVSSSQTITINKHAACIVPEVNISVKKFTDFNFFGPIPGRIVENTKRNKIDFSATSLRLYQTKGFRFKPIKQKPFLVIVHYRSEKEDHHHLS
jgi:hypothetical protein